MPAARGRQEPGCVDGFGIHRRGAIAGIIIAFLVGVPKMKSFNDKIEAWSGRNPCLTGGSADLLAVIPFAFLIALLYLTGREVILAHRWALAERLYPFPGILKARSGQNGFLLGAAVRRRRDRCTNRRDSGFAARQQHPYRS
jgi:hypothetical protein